ncbi:MAG TPA: hypothetical protein DEA47_03930 [Peptococcaceae bacterium]|nr:hypothetical protein [Peptococcaceae bacterium]
MNFFSFFKWIERFLIACTVLSFALLILGQFMMIINPVDFYMNFAEKIEGKTVNFYEEFPEMRVASQNFQSVFATITIRLENFSSLEKAVLLINGKEVADFRKKQVTVKVSQGDVLAIDGTYYVHDLTFKVVSVSENVRQPKKGQIVNVSGDVVVIGPVELK